MGRAKAVAALEAERLDGAAPAELAPVFETLGAAGALTAEERAIVKAGCLINYNRDRA